MTNHGVLERPQTRAKVLAWLLEGKSPTEVAALVSTPKKPVSRQAICAFRNRHAAELKPLVETIEKQITDYAIASKVNRIAALDDRWHRMQALIVARSTDNRYDEPGYETGLMVHQLKGIGKGEDFQLVDLYVTDSGLLAEMRATERAVADELGQMPKEPAVSVNVGVAVVLSFEDGSPA